MAGPSGPAFFYNFYPRSPCGERLFVLRKITITIDISIHALLAESDARSNGVMPRRGDFYPRSPCGERLFLSAMGYTPKQFLSTLSLRRATVESLNFTPPKVISIHALLAESDTAMVGPLMFSLYFYPRSPCGERPTKSGQGASDQRISIHALLAESDVVGTVKLTNAMLFLSTLSLRRATRCITKSFGRNTRFLSTLSLRRATVRWRGNRTNPLFLSTLSLRRATQVKQTYQAKISISIHALLAESDFYQANAVDQILPGHFYPRSPCGERPSSTVIVILRKNFYPRSPCGERREVIAVITEAQSISIHALLAESDALRQL